MEKVIKVLEKDHIVIRFSGDSGDGMQLTGTQFAATSALFGNDISTFPDYPAEIRAPQGTIGGVSGFQLHIGQKTVYTPGDFADVLVAMNPAALRANLKTVAKNAVIIVNKDAFTAKNIEKAGYTENPLENGSLEQYKVISVPISSLTKEALSEFDIDAKTIDRSKNMFALGLTYWLFEKELTHTDSFLDKKFKKKGNIAAINKKVLRAGYNYGEATHVTANHYVIAPAKIKKGTYRTITGNEATAWGLMAATEKANLPLFCGSYPITPATDILQYLAAYKELGIKTFQAEDEIAGICTAIGASFAGNLAVTTTSGPGLALKTEAAGLAVMTELPLVIIDVQRGGPSTGLPTKTEQSDLLQAIHGRNGESPLIVMAASTPTNCFDYAYYAAKLTLEHMTPVILLTDGFIANGAEPWRIPSMDVIPEIKPRIASLDKEYQPYQRDEKTLAREWAFPGMKGLEHRIGGLEKENITGHVSHSPLNHQIMSDLRKEKVERVADSIPDQKIYGKDNAETLIVGWGGTFGHLLTAVEQLVDEGHDVALAQFNYIHPLPKNTKELFKDRKNILVCELNQGQFLEYLRGQFPHVDFKQYNKLQGLPFTVKEIKEAILNLK
ncbi:2-oxoglutarate ferredoxin oxidoreductase subunit alpha [Balneicella halophila]|uniref:2-oxoglutarate ferredoxin oxidoreductase subunit alpha n=1 Tax=Balneicella halophila TaxID=1537566 RepID=A0A7L4UNT0_BALHA|nr:2-oxoacid:acceptor oxidoreductase subunit alpha [Balneicella halophila]PVX49988.1 2-oxoglutarate ferredoxin oxidoreductase subunit alpha [Balneicella halophila]